MDDIHKANSNSSYEAYKDKSNDFSTIGSFKASITSFLQINPNKRPAAKINNIYGLKSEDHSTEIFDDDIDEDCDKKTVANFQKNYLELGQWPEVPIQVFQEFKNKYKIMKEKLNDCRSQKEKVQNELRKYKNGEVQCKDCVILKEKNNKTKIALEEAVSLSHLLLKQLKKYDSCGSSISE